MMLLLVSTITVFAQTARLQVIHNSPQPSASPLSNFDAYVVLGGVPQKILDDFSYREATPFITVPAGVPINVHIAPANSTSIQDTIGTLGLPAFTNATVNYLIANGDGAQPNFLIFSGGVETSSDPAEFDLLIFHGSDDAPAVDIQARGLGTAADNLEFEDLVGIISLPIDTFVFDIFDSTATTFVKAFYAPLNSTFAGLAGIAFASGYLNPAAGQPGFVIFIALSDGRVVPLPEINRSLVQVIHASPDPNATTIDLYVTNDLEGTAFKQTFIDNFPFKNATTFVPFEFISSDVSVDIAPSNSTSVNDAFAGWDFGLTAGTNYTVVAAGSEDASFADKKPFDLFVFEDAKLFTDGGLGSNSIDINVFHGSNDAPTVDLEVTAPSSAVGNIGNDLSFGEFSGYSETPFDQGSFYTIAVKTANGISTIANSTALPLGLNPQANGLGFNLYVLGFVSPANNDNGPSLQLCASALTGNPSSIGLLCFDLVLVTAVEEKTINQMIMYPNPTKGNFNIEYTLETPKEVRYNVYNTMGQLVLSANEGTQNVGRNAVNFDLSNFSTGQYMVQLLVGEDINITRSFIKE